MSDYVKVTDLAERLHTNALSILRKAHSEMDRRFAEGGVEAIEGMSTGTKWMPGGGGLQAVVSTRLAEVLTESAHERSGHIPSFTAAGLCGYPLGGSNPGTCREPLDHDRGPNRTRHVSDGQRT